MSANTRARRRVRLVTQGPSDPVQIVTQGPSGFVIVVDSGPADPIRTNEEMTVGNIYRVRFSANSTGD